MAAYGLHNKAITRYYAHYNHISIPKFKYLSMGILKSGFILIFKDIFKITARHDLFNIHFLVVPRHSNLWISNFFHTLTQFASKLYFHSIHWSSSLHSALLARAKMRLTVWMQGTSQMIAHNSASWIFYLCYKLYPTEIQTTRPT